MADNSMRMELAVCISERKARMMRLVLTVGTLSLALSSFGLYGQSVISAKAGVIHYTEGEVVIGSGAKATPVETHSGGRYSELKDDQELSTREGRAEVLLNPGGFLRLGENSSVKMISNRLSDTRLELTRGVALIEVADVSKDNAVTILVNKTAVSFEKLALVRLDAENGIRVYKGEVQVMVDGNLQTLKDGREMQFTASNAIVKFDSKSGDPLYRWANRRAEYIAMANIASANMARQSSALTGYPAMGGWYYNSYYGMMTYLPFGNGMFRSPFGYFYYSPARVQRYYQSFIQQPVYAGGGGSLNGGGMSGRSWNSDNGYYTTQSRSAGAVSMPAPSGGGSPAAAAPAAPAAGRGADVGTSRGGGSGRSGH